MFFTRKNMWWLFACVFVFYIRPRSRNWSKEERLSVHRRTFMIWNLDCCRVRGRINLIHMAVRTYGDEIESWRSCAPVILNIRRGRALLPFFTYPGFLLRWNGPWIRCRQNCDHNDAAATGHASSEAMRFANHNDLLGVCARNLHGRQNRCCRQYLIVCSRDSRVSRLL